MAFRSGASWKPPTGRQSSGCLRWHDQLCQFARRRASIATFKNGTDAKPIGIEDVPDVVRSLGLVDYDKVSCLFALTSPENLPTCLVPTLEAVIGETLEKMPKIGMDDVFVVCQGMVPGQMSIDERVTCATLSEICKAKRLMKSSFQLRESAHYKEV